MESELTKKYYKIKDVAEFLGVAQSTIRYWEREFDWIQPQRSVNNQRFYTPKDIENLRIVHYLIKIKGLKIDAARQYLKSNKKNLSRKLEILDELKSVKSDLENMLRSLNLRAEKLGINDIPK